MQLKKGLRSGDSKTKNSSIIRCCCTFKITYKFLSPTKNKWGSNSTCSRGCNTSYPFRRPFVGLIAPFSTGRGPPCSIQHIFFSNKNLHPRKLTWQWKNNHWKMNLLLSMGIFRWHVSFQGCSPNLNSTPTTPTFLKLLSIAKNPWVKVQSSPRWAYLAFFPLAVS